MLGSEIRELVIVKMEEHTPFGDKSGETLLAGGDILSEVKPVYSYIDATLPEAANEALMVIPIEHLTPIAVDLLNDEHLDEMFIQKGSDDKRYYPASSGEVSVLDYHGKMAVYSGGLVELNGAPIVNTAGESVVFSIQTEGAPISVTAYRYSSKDIDDYYCYATIEGSFYYVGGGLPISEGSPVYRDITSPEISSVDEVIAATGTTPIVFFRGWATSRCESIYTLGIGAPEIGDNFYVYTNNMMVSAGKITGKGVVSTAEAEPDADDDRIGIISKPFDYLRLHTLQMGSWTRPVHAVVRPDNPLYVQQFDKWTRGHYCKPVVTDDGKDLHYYSQSANATAGEIKNILYVPEFDLDTDYPKNVAEVIAIHTAGKIYEIFSQTEQMGIMAKEMESVLSTMKL